MSPLTLVGQARSRRRPKRTPFDQLVRTVAVRVPQPIDPLEIAAVIESMGITDAAARSTYGKETVFGLAEDAFPLVSKRAQHAQGHGSDDPQAESRERAQQGTLDAAVSTLLTLIPLLIVALSTRELAREGYAGKQVLAVTVGVSCAMVALSGPLLAVARKTAVYRVCGYAKPPDRFARRVGFETAALACVVTLVCSPLIAARLGFAFAVIFALSFDGFAIIWIFTSSLVSIRRPLTVTCAVAAGVTTGVATLWIRPSVAGPAGIAVTAVLLAYGLTTIKHDDGALTRPSRRFLAADGAPYAAYGLVLMLFLAEPHIAAGASGDGLRQFSVFELSFGLALVPLVAAAILLERLLHGFWGFIRRTERRLDPKQFAIISLQLFRWKLLFFGGVLALLSVIAGVCFTALRHDVSFFSRVDLVVLVIGLIGFWLFGCAQFVSLLLLNFGRPQEIVKAAGAGVVVATVISTPTALLVGRDAAAVGFIGGAAIFLALATLAARNTFQHIDYYYASAF
jgi:hypothetical protein